ncbi:beta-ketoacyl-[acyl-carrier-protein] synthase family protein [Omnitrophica bacterium]|nr:beta-ketoacyl-[acyl-carrier-protein] synthase family protein [Candidatus Omnitrophota bacterium]
MNKRRVVITGLGVVSSIGIGKDEFWKNLIAGKSGISEVTTFDTSKYDNHRGGEVKDFDPLKFITRKFIKEMGRVSQFAVSASKMALEDARLTIPKVKKGRIGVIMGTTMAGIQSLEEVNRHWMEKGEDDVWATTVIKYPGNVLSDSVGHYFGMNGPTYVIPTACAAGNYSIGYSYDLIRTGKVDVMLAGGTDPFSRITFTGFSRLFAMARDKCQPFDKNRKGMMIGEGAGVLALEDLEHALERKVPIYAEVLGYGLSCDASHMTAPTEEGIAFMMKRAMKNSGIDKKEVDYICAHGTGTPSNDKTECKAAKTIFGDYASKIPMSSIKSMLGHTMGAASAIEAISTILTIKDGVIPPTINHEEEDPECVGVNCVPNRAIRKEVKVALNNSLAFGGNNACVAFKRYE